MREQYSSKSFLDVIIEAVKAQKKVTKVTEGLTSRDNIINTVTSERLQRVTDEVAPLDAFRSVSKKPDQCLGGICQWYSGGKCETTEVANFFLKDGQCPQNRWRVLISGPDNRPCSVCASADWWRPKGQNWKWLCVVCHPPVLQPFLCELKSTGNIREHDIDIEK